MSKKKEYKSLLTVLAISCPDGCRDILRKYGEDANARNPRELEMKLAKLYATSSQKIDIEKDFAAVHPHKDFILKYNKPEKEYIVRTENPVVIETPPPATAIEEKKSSADGDCDCGKSKDKSNREEFYNADATTSESKSLSANQQVMMLSVLGIVAIVTLAMYMKK
jgi:hypothetical protein